MIHYDIMTLISGVLILSFGLILLGFKIPSNAEWSNYRLSRFLLAIAYIILGMTGVFGFMDMSLQQTSNIIRVYALIAASYQAFFFTFSLVTMVNTHFMTKKRICLNLIPILLLSMILLIFISGNMLRSEIVLIIFSLLYGGQLICYIWIFRREYEMYLKQIDQRYLNSEEKKLRWIKGSFYMALAVGVMAFLSFSFLYTFYLIFTVIYTILYGYFTVKYINYVTAAFSGLSPVTEDNTCNQCENASNGRTEIKECLNLLLDSWLKDKKYLDPDITLESLSVEFKTNRTYLSADIKERTGKPFRTWICELRIQEAQQLMNIQPDRPVYSIAEQVGIYDKSSFYRQFLKVVGMTPGEYRGTLHTLNIED